MGETLFHQVGPGELVVLTGVYAYLLFKLLPTLIAFSILIASLGAIYYYLNDHNEYWHKKGVPGPKGNILFGSMLEVFKSMHEFDKRNTEKYGKTFGTIMNGVPDIQSQDLDLIKEIVIKNFDSFPDRVNIARSKPDDIRGAFLTVKQGDDWRRIRHRITPAFTSGKMKKLLPAMNYCSNELVKYLDQYAKSGNDVPLKDALSKLTMNVIGRTVFAADLNSFDDKEDSPFLYYAKRLFDIKLMSPAILFIVSFPNVARWYTMLTGRTILQNDIFQYFTTSLTDIMDQRLKDPDSPNKYNDAFQLLLNSLDGEERVTITSEDADIMSEAVNQAGNSKEKKTLSRLEVLAQLVIFLAAGYETTASTLHFVCYILSRRPDVQEKLRKEVLEVLDGREHIDYEDMAKLQYLNQVVSETLRMYPPAIRINRLCQKDAEINGIEFEKGNSFSFDVYNIHHDPENYPEPYEFDPDRFSPENKADRHPMAFIPFGAGPRICLGMRFAEFEMRVTLVDLVKNFEFLPSEGMPGLPVPILSKALLNPAVELKCRIKKI